MAKQGYLVISIFSKEYRMSVSTSEDDKTIEKSIGKNKPANLYISYTQARSMSRYTSRFDQFKRCTNVTYRKVITKDNLYHYKKPNKYVSKVMISHSKLQIKILKNNLKRRCRNKHNRNNRRKNRRWKKKKRRQYYKKPRGFFCKSRGPCKKFHRPLFELNEVDLYTNGLLPRMMIGEKPMIKELFGVIGEGKESIVYYGTSSKSGSRMCAIKIYKPNVYKLKLHEKYLDGDFRYDNLYDPKLGQHELISLWARKEADNLKLLWKSGIPCPRVVARKKNVLIMTTVNGIDVYSGIFAYSYKFMSHEQLIKAYDMVVEYMRIMFRKAHLVHGDLSSRNIIWFQEKIYLIDVSQAVDKSHEDAFNMLFRDCSKVTQMFNQAGVEKLMTKQELFTFITSQRYDKEGLRKLSGKIKNYRLYTDC